MSEACQIIIEREVPCVVRDGVTLYANIYRPAEVGSYPVLLTRLPYNKNLPDFSHRYIDPIRMAMNGFIVIIQDVRGRFASEGEFVPFLQEFEDGYDTVEWAAKLPYANGKVGMFGLSYYGFTQLYAALERPPSLKAIFPAMTGNLSQNGLFARENVTELAAIQTWVLDSVAYDYLKRDPSVDYAQAMKEIVNDLNHIEEAHKHVPYKEWPPIQKHEGLIPFFEKYFINDFGQQLFNIAQEKIKNSGQIDIPAYHLAGWYDSHLAPTLLNYEDMQNDQRNQKLIVGPWSHGFFDSDIGERAFGSYASGHAIDGNDDITSLHIKWFSHWLKEESTTMLKDDLPVKIFVMGINEWRSEKEWPLKRTAYTPIYLTSDGTANRQLRSGLLQFDLPEKNATDHYIYDPRNPVPSHGGGTLFYKGRNAGPRDQREIAEREDLVVYTSEPLEKALEVTGWIKVKLWVSSDVNCTDFTAKLIDVLPDGRAYNLTDGISRISLSSDLNESSDHGEGIVECEIDLWATSNVFLPGHSIRVEISSSNFPRFDVNPNTGKTTLNSSEMIQANQMIYHGKDYPSHIILPIIPKS